MGDRVIEADLFEAFASAGRAPAGGERPEPVDLPARGERSAETPARSAGLGPTTASNHLRAPEQAGPVTAGEQGTTAFYRLPGGDAAALWAPPRQVGAPHLADGMLERRPADLPAAT